MITHIFTYDLTRQVIIDNSDRDLRGFDSIYEYKIGQILVDFLNFDFATYDKNRIKANKIFAFNNYDYGINDDNFDNEKDYKSHENAIKKLVHNSFSDIAPIYFDVAMVDDCEDDLYSLAIYLLDIVSDIPYFQNYDFLSYEQFKNDGSLDLKKIQDKCKPIFTSCLDIDVFPDKTALQKYMELYDYSYFMSGPSFTEKTIFRYSYSKEEQLTNETFQTKTIKHNSPFLQKLLEYKKFQSHNFRNAEAKWKNRTIEIIHGYTFKTPEEALHCEFLKMLELGINIRKCAVCGKYFVVSGHNGKCCDNLYGDTGLTCQQVYADRNYKNKRKKNPILKEYDKAYKRMYARYSSRKNLSSEKYNSWKEAAARERDKALAAYAANPSDTIINDFKSFLKNK